MTTDVGGASNKTKDTHLVNSTFSRFSRAKVHTLTINSDLKVQRNAKLFGNSGPWNLQPNTGPVSQSRRALGTINSGSGFRLTWSGFEPGKQPITTHKKKKSDLIKNTFFFFFNIGL